MGSPIIKRRGLKASFSITDLPEALAAIRMEMANALRAEARSESDPRLVRRLHEIAEAFEAGQRRGP